MSRVARNPLDPPVVDKILAAALRQFGKAGYEASMKDIAEDAGVTAAALYYHYKDKRDLLFKGLESIARELYEACNPQVDAAKEAETAFRQFVTGYIRYQLTQLAPIAPMYASLVHGTRHQQDRLTPRQMRTLRELEHRFLDTLRNIIEAGKVQRVFKVESAKLAAFAVIGMCEHTVSWVDPKGELTPDQIADHYARLGLRMLGASA